MLILNILDDVCLPCSNRTEFVTWVKFKASKLKYRIKDACTNTSAERCLPFKVGKKSKDMAKIMVVLKDELCSERYVQRSKNVLLFMSSENPEKKDLLEIVDPH